MAKCDIAIEFEDDRRAFVGGETVRGRVTVRAHEEIRCNALTVAHRWTTQGRGNITTGSTTPLTLHSGVLRAGDTLSRDFSIETLGWPPSYQGHYLTINHSIDARIDVPWAFDIHASEPIRIHGTSDAAVKGVITAPAAKGGAIAGCVVGGIILLFVVVFFMVAPVMLLLAPVVALVLAISWFFKSFLPRRKLGATEFSLESKEAHSGETVRGQLRLNPSRPLRINGVTQKLSVEEVCVSGSGTDQKTHRHTLHEDIVELAPSGTLPAGERVFNIQAPLPAQLPPSLKLTSNEIEWRVSVQVDIPRWPDFTRQEKLTVLPARSIKGGTPAGTAGAFGAGGSIDIPAASLAPSLAPVTGSADYGVPAMGGGSATSATGGEDIPFEETADFLVAARDDAAQIDALVEAVRGLAFEIDVEIDRTLLYAGGADREHAYTGGRIALAEDPRSGLRLTLYFPSERTAELDLLQNRRWRGMATVVGYDAQHDRLQMRVH